MLCVILRYLGWTGLYKKKKEFTNRQMQKIIDDWNYAVVFLTIDRSNQLYVFPKCSLDYHKQ